MGFSLKKNVFIKNKINYINIMNFNFLNVLYIIYNHYYLIFFFLLHSKIFVSSFI